MCFLAPKVILYFYIDLNYNIKKTAQLFVTLKRKTQLLNTHWEKHN